MNDLQPFIDEYVREVVGERTYAVVLDTARAVIFGGRYPPSYSPHGRWDDDAIAALAHDWLEKKLLRLKLLEHFLRANESERGFRKGLELSFRDYLIGQRSRSALDNLFQRTHARLESDDRFECVVGARRKAAQVWGLRGWRQRPSFDGPEADLIAAGLRVRGLSVIRFREDARKLSPILSDAELVDFIARVLEEIGAPISLAQFATIFRYRFDLLDAREVSLDEPEDLGASGGGRALIETLAASDVVEDAVLLEETVQQILRVLTTRQQRVLLEYARAGRSLAAVAAAIGCAKGTVDNELRRAMEAIRRHTDSLEEGEAARARLVAVLSEAWTN